MAIKQKFRQRRDFKGLKERRIKAGKMFAAGKKQADIARALKVSTPSVARWHSAWKKGGLDSLKGAGRAGRKSKITKQQLVAIDKALKKGPKENGFHTDLWTLPRIAKIIEQITGIKYHPGHVWKILPLLGWTLQKPARQAIERNEKAVRRWMKNDWKRIKKKPSKQRPG